MASGEQVLLVALSQTQGGCKPLDERVAGVKIEVLGATGDRLGPCEPGIAQKRGGAEARAVGDAFDDFRPHGRQHAKLERVARIDLPAKGARQDDAVQIDGRKRKRFEIVRS